MARQVALVSNSLFLLFITYIHVRADERKRAVGGYLCASFDRNGKLSNSLMNASTVLIVLKVAPA